ncbi:MAG: carbohydrate binding domain-containing protein, partial [Candidatus Ratteibacteria bacterium]|nr:carbohydrate binding domain-containing protein [Candidatus Ratteibacteria bacterium]
MKKIILLFAFSILFLSVSLGYCAGPKNLFSNPDFESDDLSVWVARGGEVSRTDTSVFDGKYSLQITKRTENEDGVFQDITDKVAQGYAYTVSGQTMTGKETGWDKLAVYLILNEDAEEKQIFLGSSDARNTGWAGFSYKFTIPDTTESYKFGLLFRPSFSTTDFYLDGLSLRPSVQVRSSSTKDGNKLSVNIGPLTNDQKGLKAELKVQDVLDKDVFTDTLNLAEDALIDLKSGFYRASVKTVDSDGESFAVEKTFCVGNLDGVVDLVIKENEKLIASSSMSAYHGWLKYLQYLLDDTRERFPDNIEAITNAAYRLDKWVAKITEDPNLINKISGVIEWAYLSQIDDSGQPFKLAIPTDYTPDKSFALEVDLHGKGGNHLEYSGGLRSQPDRFQLHVLGRARGGGFTFLSEADVLDAIEYVKKYWSIDPRKIHLVGRSMGGRGTYYFCTR